MELLPVSKATQSLPCLMRKKVTGMSKGVPTRVSFNMYCVWVFKIPQRNAFAFTSGAGPAAGLSAAVTDLGSMLRALNETAAAPVYLKKFLLEISSDISFPLL
jgi:hypothetical protein